MGIVRSQNRYIHATLVAAVRDGLTALGWFNTPAPFGAANIVELTEYEIDDRRTDIRPNTVTFTLGDEEADVPEEMGANLGGLKSVTIPFFADIYGEEQAISIAIASDIKSILTDAYMPLRNWAIPADNVNPAAPPITGAYIEVEDVVGPERPVGSTTAGAESFKRYWRVVRGVSTTYWSE
jgi:hypothetical protein